LPLTILGAGAVKHAMTQLLHTPGLPPATARFDTVGAVRDAVLAGEPAGLVLLSEAALDALEAAGRITAHGRITLGRTGVGFAVPRDAAPLDTATPDTLAATLRATDGVIAMADPERGATAGIHFRAVLQRLDLWDALQPKLKCFPTGIVAVAEVAAGRASIGVSQASEIVAADGVRLGGTLPDALQLFTTYGAATTPAASDAAGTWLALLASPAGRAAFTESGFTP
jgi:molybdate transport system substrate-binding protein